MWYCFLTHAEIGDIAGALSHNVCNQYRPPHQTPAHPCCAVCMYCAGEGSDYEKEYTITHSNFKPGIKKRAKLPKPAEKKKFNRFAEIDLV
jgi:hypothetical protein